jgi:hypothetical protein
MAHYLQRVNIIKNEWLTIADELWKKKVYVPDVAHFNNYPHQSPGEGSACCPFTCSSQKIIY